nr:hypothetical protein [Tanacetum cinerariifolium]
MTGYKLGLERENEIFETIINKLHDEWFKGTDEDDEDLEGIIDFLEPTLYDEFIDSGDEEYKERKCRMLEIPYIKPPPILIEKVNVTRYSIGPGEVYRKIKISRVEELSMTRGNIATIRAKIMNEFLKNDDKKESYDATEIKKVNEKVYAAQVGRYKTVALGFSERDNGNTSYQERRQMLEELLNKFMAESAKRHDEYSSLIKEIQTSTDAAIRNQGASIKALEIQIREMSKVLQERGSRSPPSSTITDPRDHVQSITTIKEAKTLKEDDKMPLIELIQATIPFPGYLKKNSYDEKEVFVTTRVSRRRYDAFDRDVVEMSQDVLTIGSTMRIPLLYRGEYLQWVERFMNYLEEQTNGEAMINSIKNGDQPLLRVTQVSIAGTTSTEQPPLEDKSMWSDQEKRIQKIDCLARSLLIQGLPNDIYSLIDSNKTAKDLWDALARHMLGSEYGKQDRKAAFLYEYETFKATRGELLLDTYIRYLQVINDLKKCGYSKDNYVNDTMGSKKKTVVVTSDPLALIAEKTNVSRSKEKVVVSSDSEGSETDDFNELKKITALYDEQVLLAEDQAWMESNSDSDQEINANMVFMAQIEKVLSDSEASSSSADEKISEVSYYLSESESESEFETSEYYDNSTNYGLFVNNDDDQ